MFDFSDLPVPLWQWIVSQVIGVIALVFVVLGFQMKKKPLMLVCLAISNVLSAVMQGFLGNFIMAGIAGVVVFRLLAYAWLHNRREQSKQGAKNYSAREKTVKPIPLWFDISILVVALALNIPVAIFTATWWFDWVFFGVTMAATFAQWTPYPHVVRLAAVIPTIMVLIAAIFFTNFISLITEIFALVSIGVFYVRYFVKKSKNKYAHKPLATDRDCVNAIRTQH
ncbi:MAG: YgjV family protein [Firmicutes bacterium]|nr:YgjV family protein [Bacillota bacterium]